VLLLLATCPAPQPVVGSLHLLMDRPDPSAPHHVPIHALQPSQHLGPEHSKLSFARQASKQSVLTDERSYAEADDDEEERRIAL